MLRVLLTPRWLGALAAAVVFAVACLFLGRWQWHRFETRHHISQVLNAHYHSAPVPIRKVLPNTDAVPGPDEQWTVVRVSGSYQPADLLLVRNRPLDTAYGYEILVPLRSADGPSILVDRGWVPNGESATTRPALPPTPSGTITVTGWLRSGEADLNRPPVPGELASINIGQARTATGADLYDAYVLARDEHADPPQRITRGQPLPVADTEGTWAINLSYAIQWWLGMAAGFVLVYAGARREHLENLEASGRRVEPVKPKKVRIWDEEDA